MPERQRQQSAGPRAAKVEPEPPAPQRVPPEPSELASMHGRIVDQLGSRIASGAITGIIDPVRIAAQLGVSRSLVRECLRTLAAKGMVQARQRAGTTVTDSTQWALLDEQVIRWRASGPHRFAQLPGSLELRERLEPLAARLTARERDATALTALAESARAIEQATRTRDLRLMIEADTVFHRLLYLSSGNEMLARLAGTVHACLQMPDFQHYHSFSADSSARHSRLVTAIRDQDADGAETIASDLVALTSQIFLDAQDKVLRRSVSAP